MEDYIHVYWLVLCHQVGSLLSFGYWVFTYVDITGCFACYHSVKSCVKIYYVIKVVTFRI